MAVTTSPYVSDALPSGTVDAVVISGGAAGQNGAPMLRRLTGTYVSPGGRPGLHVWAACNATDLAAQSETPAP